MRTLLFFAILTYAASAQAGTFYQQDDLEDRVNCLLNDERVINVIQQGQAKKDLIEVDFDAEPVSEPEAAPAAATKAEAEPVPVSTTEPEAASETEKGHRHFGLEFDLVGVPDLSGAALVYRPWQWVRLHLGAVTDWVSPGVAAGLTLRTPGTFGLSLTAEAGRVFEGNAGNALLLRLINGGKGIDNVWIKHIGYDYANGHLGLEIGNERVTAYLHVGVSVVSMTVKNFQQGIQSQTSGDTQYRVTADDPNLFAIVPSGKLGLIVYFGSRK